MSREQLPADHVPMAVERRLRAFGRCRAEERGSTLIELLLVASLLVIVLGVVFGILTLTARNTPREHERAHSIREVQVGLHRMTRELRQAYAINATSFTRMDVNLRIGAANRRVAYDCGVNAADPAYRSCVRYETAIGSALPAEGTLIVDRLLNGTADEAGRVFFPDDPLAPTFVRARVEVPARGDAEEGYSHKVVLDDGIYLRNLKLG